ncbi:uncharacterized protein LOC109708015 [Ananas comosus]|uniref:Uncharacterized protein LOC109708015 n=1 Tax=Ananas comosus TaxID=4615 RepID=A0A6P5ENW0_ANACO|nr:uncharacterized protein LOC109708015 [Ananas comosus]
MSIVEACNSDLPFPLFRHKPSDETLIPHLRSPPIALARISGAVDLLALDSHLDASLALLDACNVASAAIDLLRRRLLPLRLLAASSDSSRRARDAIAEWAAAPRGRISAVRGVIAAGRSLAATEEVAAVDAAVRKLTAAVDDGAETERLRGAVSEVGRVTEELTAGLDRLGRAVDAEFRAVMASRNAALQRIRFGPTKKYYNK